MNAPSPRSRRGSIALAVSLLLHAALVAWLAWKGPAPTRISESRVVELEVMDSPRSRPPVPVLAPAAKASAPAASRPRARQAARAAAEAPAAVIAPSAMTTSPQGLAVPDSPREPSTDLPRAGAFGALALDLSGDTARQLAGVDPDEERKPDAGPTEQELVTARIGSMFAEARAAHRAGGAVDGAVAGLGRGFEQAARRASFTPDLQRWVDAALKKYREEARRFGSLGRDDSTDTWARIEDRALRGVDRSEATYVAVVELRQASDGSLLDLKLVVSSGAQEFDSRALGSVADGLKADATAFASPRPEGTLSLWALLGHRQTESEVLAAAQKVYRFALLDVVDLKPTVIDLERRGRKEQLRFSARLLAVY